MSEHKHPRILIIDNDQPVATSLAVRFRSLHYECVVVSDGQEGIEAFESQPFDLVITDLNMPSVDGIGVVHKLRALSPVPIIIITGYQREYRGELAENEDLVVLSKPFPAAAIMDLVETELAMAGVYSAA